VYLLIIQVHFILFQERESIFQEKKHMKSQTGLDYFWPYDSIDEIFSEKVPPEFGIIPSKWRFSMPAWRFFHAANRDIVPINFQDPSYDDSLWDAVDLPSVWQQEGYGLPDNLVYDAVTKEADERFAKRIQTKLSSLAGSEADDDIGLYRTWVCLPEAYIDRAVYFVCCGIRGRFELYINGNPVLVSDAWYSTRKIQISGFLVNGNNQITLLIYRLDSDRHGRVRKENGTFGYSGIFRMPEIIAESNIEISEIRLRTTWTGDEKSFAASSCDPNTPALEKKTQEDDPDASELSGLETNEDKISGNSNNGTKDAELRLQISLFNHTDLNFPIHIECQLLESCSEYDLYHLPEHPITVLEEMKGNVSGCSELNLHTLINARSIRTWSDQTPYLYDLILTVLDANDQVICVKKRRFGFRTTEIIGHIFHINETAMPLRAVRYFDFDPVGGLCVSEERMKQDILLIKQAHLNAVLTAHFPSDPLFYQLCDHYGLYVICQADSAHITSAVESLMTHPCISFWSFAPFHYDESKLWELKQKLLVLDSSRPFYCEKEHSLTLSDIKPFPGEAGKLFGEWSDICIDKIILQSKIVPGESLFGTLPGRARRDSDSADFKWIHQGDMEEYHEKMDVPIAQGIVSADRIPHPIYYEIKKQCETLLFVASERSSSDLRLTNLYPVGKTPELSLSWQILMEGRRIRGGHGIIHSLEPLESRDICLPFSADDYLSADWMQKDPSLQHIYMLTENQELVLDIRVCFAEDTAYALKGFETAFYQQVIVDNLVADLSENTGLAPAASPNMIITTRPESIKINHPSMQINFSRETGGLCSLCLGAKEMISGSMKPSFYRAATNSDRSDQSFILAATVFSRETDWRTIQNDLCYQRFHYEMAGDDFSMLVHYKSFAFKNEVLVRYILGQDGRLKITLAFTPRYELLRSGFRVNIPCNMKHLAWYGRGFHEAYPDRKESSRIGFFEAVPEMLYYEYSRPQENGGHCDTKYLIISDHSGSGLKITSDNGAMFSFSASVYSPEDIDDHQHQEELTKKKDTYELFLDFYQRDIERTGQITSRFIKNQTYKATFIFEPWKADQSMSSDHEFL
jgi:beta-galactosidase/beta-glucuronidase